MGGLEDNGPLGTDRLKASTQDPWTERDTKQLQISHLSFVMSFIMILVVICVFVIIFQLFWFFFVNFFVNCQLLQTGYTYMISNEHSDNYIIKNIYFKFTLDHMTSSM